MFTMHFLLILLIEGVVGYVEGNVGSTLFHNRCVKDCWNENDVAKLIARFVFENSFPSTVSPGEVNEKYVRDSMKYFRRALHFAEKEKDPQTSIILNTVLADTIGGHLNTEILPSARFAYYAGYVPYRCVRRLHNFLDELKRTLNTQGLGWKRPPRTPVWANLTVTKIAVGRGKFANPCINLVCKRDSHSCLHFPSPKTDDVLNPSSIVLPFKTGGLVSLTSPASENIILKYYTTASRCILKKSPKSCRHADFVNFNNDLWHWLKREVAPHLMDEKLYTAYGGVLRIASQVQNYGKGLSRRNLFENRFPQGGTLLKYSSPNLNIDSDWTPKIYICFVLIIALILAILQICFSYLSGYPSSCHCLESKSKSCNDAFEDKRNSCDSGKQSMPSVFSFKNQKCFRKIASKIKTSSFVVDKPQKMYDLNESTEKLLKTIMKSQEGSFMESQSSEMECLSSEEEIEKVPTHSPPRIDTPIAQLEPRKIMRSNRKRSTEPMFSTTSTSRPMTKTAYSSDSTTSESTTTSSDDSRTSVTSTRNPSSSFTRDLTLTRTDQQTRTEQDFTSFTTPTFHE